MHHTSPCDAPPAGHIVPGELWLCTGCFARNVGNEECRMDKKGLLIVMARVEPEEQGHSVFQLNTDERQC
jgi:hypothetical protein